MTSSLSDDAIVLRANGMAQGMNLGTVLDAKTISDNRHRCEVWTLSDGRRLVLREPGPTIQQAAAIYCKEAMLYRTLAARGDVAVPSWARTGEANGRPYLLMNCLPGIPLDRDLFASLPEASVNSIVEQCARSHAAIHRTDIDGFGESDQRLLTLVGPTVADDYRARWESVFEKVAATRTLTPAELERLRRLVGEGIAALPQRLPLILVHGDYWGHNILATDGPLAAVSGVLDFEHAGRGVREHDLGLMFCLTLASHENASSLCARYLDAYTEVAQPPEGFRERIRWNFALRVSILIEHSLHYVPLLRRTIWART